MRRTKPKKRKRKLRRSDASYVKVVGALTKDVISGEVRTGGGVFYSSLGVASTKVPVNAIAVTSPGEHVEPLRGIAASLVVIRGREAVFEIRLNPTGGRELVLVRRPRPELIVGSYGEWVVANPVCGEIGHAEGDRLYIDVQGFVRVCKEGEKVEVNRRARLPAKVRGAHANYSEVPDGGLPGKETLVSYDEDGFDLILKGEGKYRIKPERLGEHSVGTGDFLLGAYVGFRALGMRPLDAARLAQRNLEEFSTLGPVEWTRRNLGYSIS
ncbi:MAG: hypothetical protein ACP5HQ_00365 [Thermoprotei archaeon]